MKITQILITPAMASEFLRKNERNPRKHMLDQKRVKAYAKAIKDGEWLSHHQGIAFDSNGFLIDGQHRLSAVVLAGMPVQMVVAHGVPDVSVGEIDRGIRRNMRCVLGIEDKRISEIVSYFSRLVCGTLHTTVQAQKINEFVGHFARTLIDSCGSVRGRVGVTAVRAGFTYAYMHSNHIDQDILQSYRKLMLLDVRNVEQLIHTPPSIRALYHRLVESQLRVTPDQAFEYAVVAARNPQLQKVHCKEPGSILAEARKWMQQEIGNLWNSVAKDNN